MAGLKYCEFANELLCAIVEASDYGAAGGNPRGQVDVFEAADHAGLGRNENWTDTAVRDFEDKGYISNVSRPISRPAQLFVLRVEAAGRERVELIRRSRNPL